MNSELLQGFYLGDLLVEPLKGQISDHNGSRHLPPKAVEVLLCLANKPTELVTRESLLGDVWGAGHGSQEALGHAISELRQALDDHVDDPHFIQTLPRRGYRLAVTPVPVSHHTESIVIGVDNGVTRTGLFENLKNRGVLETTLAYLIVGWLLIQIADIVFSQLHLPIWAATFVTVFVIAGFPIAIILSWFLEYRDGRAMLHENSPLASRRRRFSRTYISVVGALAAASILVFVYDRNFGLPEPDETPTAIDEPYIPDNAIAVLPFLNNDGSDETQTFANGLVDDVITSLSHVPGLLVASRGDAFTLAPNSASSHVRRRLRVAMYLEGSVEMAGDEIRVIIQLIDSATGFHVFSRSFDRPREDFFDIRDEVTQLTVSSLRVALPDSTQAISSPDTRNPDLDAYILYRRGIDELDNPNTSTALVNALEWFDKALVVDPDFAAAHAGRCRAFGSMFRNSNRAGAIADAEAACGRAIELNPNLDVVHTALGLLYTKTGKLEVAERAFLQALHIRENSVEAMIGLSGVLSEQQRFAESESILLQAAEQHPGGWDVYNSLGIFYFRQGRYADAAAQFAEIVSIDPDNIRGLGNLASSYMMAGNFEAATPVYRRSIEIEPEASTFANLGLMNYYLGHYEEAEAALREAVKISPRTHLNWSNLGDILYVAGKQDAAREAFREAERLIGETLSANPNDTLSLMDIAWIHAMLGERDSALSEIARAYQGAPDDPYASYIEGLIHNHFGDTDAALVSLRRAVAKGYSKTILKAEPHLIELRRDPRFGEITNELPLGNLDE